MRSAKGLCQVALLSAMLTGAKLALSAVANVEVVTLLLLSYILIVGWRKALAITFTFVTTEILIWGVGTWVPLYHLYWPLFSIIGAPLSKLRLRVLWLIIEGVMLTAFFGVLSSIIEISFMGALGHPKFWEMFAYRYLAGVPFFITHIVSNAIILIIGLPILNKVSSKIKRV